MKITLTLGLTILGVTVSLFGQGKGPGAAPQVTKSAQALTSALNAGSLKYDSLSESYILKTDSPISSSEDSTPKNKSGPHVQVQIGTKQDKPVFATFSAAPGSNTDETVQQIFPQLKSADKSNLKIDACADQRVCSHTVTDTHGEHCDKWVCVSDAPPEKPARVNSFETLPRGIY